MQRRRKGTPGAPAFSFSGGWKAKSERGRKKGDASSEVRRENTWEAPKLRRAKATLSADKKAGRA
jgi:hypothetical protein